MAAANFYDVIVLGADVAAAVTGALLSRRGFRVLCAGMVTPVEERYALGPYMLPHAPVAFVGLESPSLRRVVTELNLVQLLRKRLEANRPSYQLLLGDHRLDVGDALLREVQRELPEHNAQHAAGTLDGRLSAMTELSNALEALLTEDLILPPDGFWDRRDATRVAPRLEIAQPPATTLSEDPLAALSMLPGLMAGDLALPSAVTNARLGDLYRRGTFRVDGGRHALHGLLHDRVRTHSGDVRPELVAERIEIERGRVAAVSFIGQSSPMRCSFVVAGMEPRALVALLDSPPKKLVDIAAVPPRRHRYLLQLVAPISALPDALGRIALSVADVNEPLDEANLLALHVADGYGQHAILSAEALTSDPQPTALAGLRKKILAHLDRVLPFVSAHVLAIHSPHDGLPVESPAGNDPTLVAPPPYAMDALYQYSDSPLLGFCGLPHQTGVKKSLQFASLRHVLPGLGPRGRISDGLDGGAHDFLEGEEARSRRRLSVEVAGYLASARLIFETRSSMANGLVT